MTNTASPVVDEFQARHNVHTAGPCESCGARWSVSRGTAVLDHEENCAGVPLLDAGLPFRLHAGNVEADGSSWQEGSL